MSSRLVLHVSGLVVRSARDESDNRMFITGCDIRANGRAGADLVVRRVGIGLAQCHGDPNRLSGGAGRDRVIGSRRTDDVLLGGKGYDFANGHYGGDDTCVAEVRKGC